MNKKNILVTGSHRSGSTWFGRVLCSGRDLLFVDEPFHESKYDLLKSPVKYKFEGILPDDDRIDMADYIKDFYSFSVLRSIGHLNPKHFRPARIVFAIRNAIKYLFNGRRILIKDPLALLSVPWVTRQFDTTNIFIIRHPAAFTLSIRNRSWYHQFEQFYDQPDIDQILPETLLVQMRELAADAERMQDIVEHGIIMWNALYGKVVDYINDDQSAIVVRHEDLSLNPFETFESLCEKADIPFNAKMKAFLEKTTSSKTSSTIMRDSKTNVIKWKSKLDPEEIKRIKAGTAHLWPEFYSESDW